MAKELTWLEYKVFTAASGPPLTTPGDNYLDITELPGITVRGDFLSITGCTVMLQTAPSLDGPWVTQASYTSATKAVLIMSAEPYAAPASQAQRLIRYYVQVPGTAWTACFRLRASLPDSMGDADILLDEKSRKLSAISSGGKTRFAITADRTPNEDEIQPWVSIRGGFTISSGYEVIMAEELHVDTDDAHYAIIDVQTLQVSGVTLVLETAMGPEGPWVSFGTFTSGYSFQSFSLTKEATGTTKLRKVLRWHLEGGGAAWNACFRITGTIV